MMSDWQAQELTDVFAFFDDDDSEMITTEEVQTSIQVLVGVSPEQASELVHYVDLDGSQSLNEQEFAEMMQVRSVSFVTASYAHLCGRRVLYGLCGTVHTARLCCPAHATFLSTA